MVALNVRLTDNEMDDLRSAAQRSGVSMNDFVRRAIADHATDRPARLRAAIEKVAAEDAELLDRLGR